MNDKWKKLKKTILLVLVVVTAVGAAISGWKFGAPGAAATIFASLCLALGFVITELLIAVITGVKKANPTAIALLFVGKLGWWAGLFYLSRNAPAGTAIPIAIGMGCFLLALVLAVLSQYGMPKISDVKQ